MVPPAAHEVSSLAPTAWTEWRVFGDAEASAGEAWLEHFRLQAFRLVIALATTGLVVMVVRGILVGGPFPLADLANAGKFSPRGATITLAVVLPLAR
jgi:hypothetical protein